MKRVNWMYRVLIVVILLALLSCFEDKTLVPVNDPIIEAVKQDRKSNRHFVEFVTGEPTSNKEFIGAMAGINGHVEWSKFKPSGDKWGPDVFIVEVTIDKKDLDGNPHKLQMQFLYNTTAEVVQWGYVEIDGVPQKDYESWMTSFQLMDR